MICAIRAFLIFGVEKPYGISGELQGERKGLKDRRRKVSPVARNLPSVI